MVLTMDLSGIRTNSGLLVRRTGISNCFFKISRIRSFKLRENTGEKLTELDKNIRLPAFGLREINLFLRASWKIWKLSRSREAPPRCEETGPGHHGRWLWVITTKPFQKWLDEHPNSWASLVGDVNRRGTGS